MSQYCLKISLYYSFPIALACTYTLKTYNTNILPDVFFSLELKTNFLTPQGKGHMQQREHLLVVP